MKSRLIAAVATALSLLAPLPAGAITVGFQPASPSVLVGSPTSIVLVISGLGEGVAPSLGSFDLDVGFDSSILAFNGATFGNQLDLFGLGNVSAVTPGVGTANLFELSLDTAADLDALQAGNFTLATLSFTALSVGNSPLSIAANAFADSLGNPLNADLVAGSIGSTTPVPEPSNVMLMGIGLAAVMAAIARRRPLGAPR